MAAIGRTEACARLAGCGRTRKLVSASVTEHAALLAWSRRAGRLARSRGPNNRCPDFPGSHPIQTRRTLQGGGSSRNGCCGLVLRQLCPLLLERPVPPHRISRDHKHHRDQAQQRPRNLQEKAAEVAEVDRVKAERKPLARGPART